MKPKRAPADAAAPLTTLEVAHRLGLAVRSVQLMVDRGELEAWKTPGGHRRISRASVERWLAGSQGGTPARRVLVIEDSTHYQNLLRLLIGQQFPQVELHVAVDGVGGLAMAGQLQPDVLLVDLLLPGIDGTTLLTSLRSHPQFSRSRLIVITSLDAERREAYRFALEGVPVVHKPRLLAELPVLLANCLAAPPRAARSLPAKP
jgi:excisionase family DNA binding protein